MSTIRNWVRAAGGDIQDVLALLDERDSIPGDSSSIASRGRLDDRVHPPWSSPSAWMAIGPLCIISAAICDVRVMHCIRAVGLPFMSLAMRRIVLDFCINDWWCVLSRPSSYIH